MCPFFCNGKAGLINHLLRKHKTEKNFIIHCSNPGCGISFTKLSSFRRHYYRKHAIEENLNNVEEDIDTTTNNSDIDIVPACRETQKSEALFLLKLKAEHNLSEKALNDIMDSTKEMLQHQSSVIKQRLSTEIPEDFFQTVNRDEMFRLDVFLGLETEHLREKFFRRHLGYIKPVSVKLGTEQVLKKVGNKHRFVEKEKNGFFIPFFGQLHELLKMPEVQEDLSAETESTFPLLDFKDGLYHNKKYFDDHPDALLFCLYHDDFEIVNPIGSHRKKHKISIFYWILLNINPAFRFKIQAIQLLGVANSSDVRKYGLSKLLEDFVESMKIIHKGKELEINGSTKTYYGTLYCVLGDTPAAQYLGGFKEGVSMAKKPCRTCNITSDELGTQLSEHQVTLRNDLEYNDHCDALEHLDNVSKGTRKYWSKEYGVTKRSILASIPDFEVTKCILHDPMHVLLEGIVKLELQLILHCFIEKKGYFTLQFLNNLIKTFPYSKAECSDKPQLLEKKALDRSNNFPMSAIETRNFFVLLPFMIGDVIDSEDKMWDNYIRLLKITLLVMSPFASFDTVETLEQLIYSFNYNFQKLHPEIPPFPKLHYLIHIPKQILNFGPGRSHMCTRLEAKHSFFKNKKWRNFKSLPLSIALHHQRWMCLRQCGYAGEKSHVYLYAGDEVSSGCEVAFHNLPLVVGEKMQMQNQEDLIPSTVLKTPNVTIKGVCYENGSVLVQSYSEEEGPMMCVIKNIYICNNIKYFECCPLFIQEFDPVFNSFICEEKLNNFCLISLELKYKWPQICHIVNGNLMVMLWNVDFCWC